MRPSLAVLTMLALALLVAPAPRASACSCLPPGPVDEELVRSDAVFLGEVVQVEDAAPEHPGWAWVTLAVEEAWKGPVAASTRVLTSPSSAMCGYDFLLGTRYLVYARALREAGRLAAGELTVSLCSRTHATWPQDPDPERLRQLVSMPTLQARPNPSVTGEVRFAWSTPAGAGSTRLEILDFQGRRVASLVEGSVPAGVHLAVWDGRDTRGAIAPAGLYWARLVTAGRTVTRKVVRVGAEP